MGKDYKARNCDNLHLTNRIVPLEFFLVCIISFAAGSLMSPSLLFMEMTSSQLRDKVEMVFNRLDTNKDGILTREEFVTGCMKVGPIMYTHHVILFHIISGPRYFTFNDKLQIQHHMRKEELYRSLQEVSKAI